MIKKSIFVVILIGFLSLVYANGNAKDVPMKDIEALLKKNTTIEKMKKCSNRDLMQFMNLDGEQFDSHIYYKGKEALSVEELLIVKVSDKETLSSIKDQVEQRIESQITTFESYGPEQVAMLDNAIITTKGNYLFYCVSKSPDQFKEVFIDAI
ncbi:hypothetical protein M2140_000734 [Clostridiales Family XIII bacterium PM5-7]